MKLAGVILMAAVVALSGSVFAQEAPEGHQHGEEASAMCPMKVEGAEVNVENTPDGVRIEIKSNDPAKAKEIQEKASHVREHMRLPAVTAAPTAQAGEAYACPMGDFASNAPGKCPTCGMDLVKK